MPVSAYDAFASLTRMGAIQDEALLRWNDVIGIRNRIVHDYMNIDMNIIKNLVKNEQYRFVVDFLVSPIKSVK